MIDQDAWNELCDLYLLEQEYPKAAFCMEELILQNPHNHLFHLRFAEIKYTQVSTNWMINLMLISMSPINFYIFRVDTKTWS